MLKILTLSLVFGCLVLPHSVNASGKKPDMDKQWDEYEKQARRQDAAINVVTGQNQRGMQDHASQLRQIDKEFQRQEDADARRKAQGKRK